MASKGSVIVSKTDLRKLKQVAQDKMALVKKAIIQNLCHIGEQAVTYARQDHPNNWGDRTGNLRSSIGYVVLDDGKPVQYGAQSGTAEGQSQTKELLNILQSKFPWGLALIVCAGMNYAAYVEAIHHKDVLTGAETKARQLADKLLKSVTQ